MFPILCGRSVMPETLVCRMGGGPILDNGYNPITGALDINLKDHSRIILKPSLDSCSGYGVMLFEKEESSWVSVSDGCQLTIEFLLSYGDDFVVQEAIAQHPDISRFNPSSLNTLRIAVYRSVKDNVPYAVASVIRICKEGMLSIMPMLEGYLQELILRQAS